MNGPLLRVFVYGSLKRGFSNHGRYCGGVRSIEAAETVGSLHRIPSGFPVLSVAQEIVLARATGDVSRDLDLQDRPLLNSPGSDVGRRRVRGEILTFADPADRLRALDRLEGFEIGHRSDYERVLIKVFSRIRQRHIAVWTYIAGAYSKHRPAVPTTHWNAKRAGGGGS